MGELKVSVEAGALLRGSVRRRIEREAWARGLDVRVQESKSLLDSTYLFTFSGPDQSLLNFKAELDDYVRRLSAVT